MSIHLPKAEEHLLTLHPEKVFAVVWTRNIHLWSCVECLALDGSSTLGEDGDFRWWHVAGGSPSVKRRPLEVLNGFQSFVFPVCAEVKLLSHFSHTLTPPPRCSAQATANWSFPNHEPKINCSLCKQFWSRTRSNLHSVGWGTDAGARSFLPPSALCRGSVIPKASRGKRAKLPEGWEAEPLSSDEIRSPEWGPMIDSSWLYKNREKGHTGWRLPN